MGKTVKKYIGQLVLKFSPLFMHMGVLAKFVKMSPIITHRLYPLIVDEKVAIYFATQDGLGTIKAFTPSPGEVVVDVGAHVGVWTVLASHHVGAAGKVVAIEPHPGNYNTLLGNIAVNDLKNVIPINVALSNHEGIGKLYVGKRSAWHSMIYDGRSQFLQSPERFVEVPCITLDKLLQALNMKIVHWIKIDVEGAEVDVLEGANDTLSMNPRIQLIIEIHKEHKKVLSCLRKLGLKQKIVNIHEDSRQHIYASYHNS